MLRLIRIILVCAAFASAVSLATISLAAPVTWGRIDVTRHSAQDGGVMMVSGELPATASLPAEAELSVPAGSELQWIGEILGGPASEDPEVKFTKTTADGIDRYRFTMTKSRMAQIEVPTSGSPAFDGSIYTSDLTWTATQDVPEVTLSLRVPQAAQIATPVPGASMQPAQDGYGLYSKTVSKVKAGDTLDLAVGYSLPAAAASTAAPEATGSNLAIPIVLVLAVIAAFIGLFFAVRRKMMPSLSDDERDSSSTRVAHTEAARIAEKDSADGSGSATSHDDDSAAPKSPMSGRTKRNLVTGAIIGILIVAAAVVVAQTTRPQLTGDTISQTFAPGEPCATATIPIKVSGDSDPRATADALFAALKPLTGLNTATYNIKKMSIDVGYCESQTTEDALRQALAPTGLVAQGEAPTAPTP